MADKDDKLPAAPAVNDTLALPTIRDHAERLQLKSWQVAAIVARLHGAHDDEGKRVFADGVSLTTRMSNQDFDAAAQVALHGRL